MIEASNNGRGGVVSTGAAEQLRARLDELVAVKILDPGERRLQALAIGMLIAAGLLVAVASPVLAVLEAGTFAVTAPMTIASLALAAAAYLSATGGLDHVAWLAGTLFSLAFGSVAYAIDAPLAAWLLGLALAPGEALVAGRHKLVLGLSGSSAAVAGTAVFFTGGLSSIAVVDLALGMFFLGYAALLVRRLGKGSSSKGDVAAASTRPIGEIADLFGAAMLSLDGEGRIVLASQRAGEWLAEDHAALEGHPLVDIVLVADRVACLKAIAAARTEGQGASVEARIRRPDGTYMPTLMRFLPADEGDDRGAVVHVAVTPLADERETALRLQTALDAAHQSSAAKSQFLAAVSHELRTPLNAIIGFSDILDQEIFGGFESDRQKEYVGLIRQSGQHLLSVVNSLLDVSKIEAGRYELTPERFAMGEAMAAAAGVIREEARRKNLRLDIRPGCRGETIVADRRACHQILLNLLSNAVKFTDTGVITLESRIEKSAIALSVSDTGIGIAEADIERLGRPFTQISSGSTRCQQGTGLGLSLVKGLAELHGGTLTIRSQPGIGTMVTVRLPIDCSRRIGQSQNLKENIVALNDARTKTTSQPHKLATRHTA